MKPVLARRHAAGLDTTGLSRALPQIQSLIEGSRQHVVSTANLTLVWLYWNVGRIITEDIQKNQKRAEYGEQLLTALADNLTGLYGRGFSRPNLQVQFIRNRWTCYEKRILWVGPAFLASIVRLSPKQHCNAIREETASRFLLRHS